MTDIRAIDCVLLVDKEMAHEATIRGLFKGDQTVAFADLGRWGGGRVYSGGT